MSTVGVDKAMHQKLGIDLFNLTWDLMEAVARTEEENDTMVHAAHASRFHWGVVGVPVNLARGEWQISRAYCMVGRPQSALHHATQSLAICLNHQLSDFDRGFAYEALARAYGLMGDVVKRDENILLAKQAAACVAQDDDKRWLLKNIKAVESLSPVKNGEH